MLLLLYSNWRNFIKLIFFIFIFTACSGLYYQPSREVFSNPKKFGFIYKSIFFKSLDGTKLHGHHFQNRSKKKTKSLILMFHGNAENLTTHFASLVWLTRMGHELLIFDYRGYGKSAGKPSQYGLHKDGIAAITYAGEIAKKRNLPLIIYGQSLGGVVAVKSYADLVRKDKSSLNKMANISQLPPIALFVLDSTFISYQDLANQKMRDIFLLWPLSPLAYLLFSDKYAVEREDVLTIKDIPTLIIHGKKDHVVPFNHGEKLYSYLANSEGKKWFWKIEDGLHIDGFQRHNHLYRKEFLKLLDNNILANSKKSADIFYKSN